MRNFVVAFLCGGLMALEGHVMAAAPLTINLSGTESSTGRLHDDGTVTGVRFQGWTGGSGPNANGWAGPPGGGGHWLSQVDYRFVTDTMLAVTGQSFELLVPGGPHLAATVTGGEATRPDSTESDLGCGRGNATIVVTLAFEDGASGDFTGCLDDGRRQPFRIWGTLTKF
jgi:hypothetical protein